MGWGVVRTKIGFPLQPARLPAIVYTSMPDVFHGEKFAITLLKEPIGLRTGHCIVSLQDIEEEFVVLSLLSREIRAISVVKDRKLVTYDDLHLPPTKCSCV